jgi:allantoicase
MDDGWETRRRRGTGNDWVRYRLTERSVIRAVEIDTGFLKGNSAGWAALSGRDGESGDWVELLPRTRLQPDTVHRFLPDGAPPVTHVRIDIFPDGGIARLRLHGSLTADGMRRLIARHDELSG